MGYAVASKVNYLLGAGLLGAGQGELVTTAGRGLLMHGLGLAGDAGLVGALGAGCLLHGRAAAGGGSLTRGGLARCGTCHFFLLDVFCFVIHVSANSSSEGPMVSYFTIFTPSRSIKTL
jgi:hypothetical protein